MQTNHLDSILPTITTFEKFEAFKKNSGMIAALANEIIKSHGLPPTKLTVFAEGTNIVFSCGVSRVIKIFPPFHLEQFTSESLVLQHLQGQLAIDTPTIEYIGQIKDWPYIIMSQLRGTLLERLWEKMKHSNKLIIMQELGRLIRQVHAISTTGLESLDCHWEQFIDGQIAHCLEKHRENNLPSHLIEQIPHYIFSIKSLLVQIKAPVLLTGEYTPMNFLVQEQNGIWHISGLIDFGDAMLGLAEYDLLGPGAFLIQGDKELLKAFLIAYGYAKEDLTSTLSHQLTALMLLHKYSNLNVQIRIKDWKKRIANIKDLEKLVWGF